VLGSTIQQIMKEGVIAKMNDGCSSERVRFMPTVKPQEVNHTNVDQDGRRCNGILMSV
jgi:hypothetical protein